jgi:hypothetical protein
MFLGFSLKPFLKKLALHRLITPLQGVFAQAFFEKACVKVPGLFVAFFIIIFLMNMKLCEIKCVEYRRTRDN